MKIIKKSGKVFLDISTKNIEKFLINTSMVELPYWDKSVIGFVEKKYFPESFIAHISKEFSNAFFVVLREEEGIKPEFYLGLIILEGNKADIDCLWVKTIEDFEPFIIKTKGIEYIVKQSDEPNYGDSCFMLDIL